MKELVKAIKNELQKICPAHISEAQVNYATQQQIDAFQKKAGIEFPQEVIDFWLSCDFEITVDSQVYHTLGIDGGPAYFIFDDLQMLIADWQENDYGNQYFPVAIDSFGGSVCMDINPGEKDTNGQLFYMIYAGEDKSGAYYTEFDSLTEFLESYLNDLKEGRFEVEDERVYPLIYS